MAMKSRQVKLGQVSPDQAKVIRTFLDTEDAWVAAGLARIPFPRFVDALKHLEKAGLIEISKTKVNLTVSGMDVARGLKLRSQKQILESKEKAKRIFKSLVASRPRSIGQYDQGYMTTNSLFERLAFMALLGDLDGKRVAILGDDDLASIGICLMAEPEEVRVFEIDKRLVDFITKIATEQGFPIKCHEQDLRYPIPGRFSGKFDTFLTDPSETIDGLKMFIGRGLSLLKPKEGCAGYFGLTMIEASTAKWARFQRWLLNNYRLAITEILPHKSYYENWQELTNQTACYQQACLSRRPRRLWFNSAFLRIETIEGFKPKSLGSIKGAIFNDDEACGLIGKEIK